MSDDLYIVVRNWDRFQHPDVTRSGTVPWIKNYTQLMSDDNYLDLTEHQALVLHRLWLKYALSRCHLRLTTASLSRHLFMRVTMRDLKALNHAGFLEFVQAERLQDASPRAREVLREEEIRKDLPLNRSGEEPKANPVDNFSEQEQEQEQERGEEEGSDGAEEAYLDVHAELAELTESLAEKMAEPWKDWR